MTIFERITVPTAIGESMSALAGRGTQVEIVAVPGETFKGSMVTLQDFGTMSSILRTPIDTVPTGCVGVKVSSFQHQNAVGEVNTLFRRASKMSGKTNI